MAFHDTVFKVRDKFGDIHNEVECQRELKDASEKSVNLNNSCPSVCFLIFGVTPTWRVLSYSDNHVGNG